MHKFVTAGLIGLMFAGWAHAETGVRFSGFGSLGAIYNDSDNLGFHRDYTMDAVGQGWSTAGDTLLGLQLNAEMSGSFDAVAQMVFKDRVSNRVSDNLEWLFLRYRPNNNWAFRAGRLGLDLYMLTEYRDVGYAYSWVRPIPEFYNLISSISRYEGADVTYRRDIGELNFEAKAAFGETDMDLQGPEQGGLFALDNIMALTLSLSGNDWLVRAAAAQADTSGTNADTDMLLDALRAVPTAVWPQAGLLAQDIAFDDKLSRYYALGFQYDDGQWIVKSELGYTESEWRLLQPYASGYLSIGRRFDDLTLYGVFARVENTKEAPRIELPESLPYLPEPEKAALLALHQAAQYSYEVSTLAQSTYSLGLRWDFYEDMALKLQWDHSEIDPKGSSLWVRSHPMGHDDRVNLFSVNLSFTF
ncbi:hypothetical protein [Shewanella litorisediminis]|uniref:Porin n=1 Tax=Shewanella litorisediminis TaxID=1173586 RepID=A0ABX7G4Z2_9GAMM|nr:hypothetical protein [Shewanella litorisediminis]MCL2917914.1 porin [Shewanella litorisediminis]QRH02349.1 hypothetical protein JQC75_02685 [Shewanella litorisediminis]